MTTGLKIGIGATLGVGAIGGTAGIAHVLSQPKNLKEDLEKDSQFEFLDTSSETTNKDNGSWTKLAEEHAKTSVKGGVSKISGLDIQAPPASTTPHPGIAQLKEKCDLFFKKTKDDKDYEQAKKDAKNWCNKKSSLLTT
ncbi:hypothetical protein A6V39_00480 [Candidatus Mycoplasma haematobovis]|uniref:Uncharacterized protein n=1 Tax=Candidatus Mycoplasma haematobovis TaxID=432608 RepID=A0A1A9QEZ7_9MOLU|nr:hypothetical protein [Candidatus Mycoplasma haematobovis]OAL10526.1 hypothetical protein A6V39_00480 [Candidatus Mycoplasma haematobovis]